MSGEKTEKPTQQRKKQARKEGTVARTPDLGAWAGLLAASIVVPNALRSMMTLAQHLLKKLPAIIARPEPADALHLLREAALGAAAALAPVCITIMLVGIVAAAAQGGIHPAAKLLVPKFDRLNPLSGLKKTLGPHGWWEGVKALLKTAALGAVLYGVFRNLIDTLMMSGRLSLGTTVATVTVGAVTIMRYAAVAGLVLAAGDYAMARRRVGKQLRMSKQEIKDEHKKTEGDPHVKGQIRARQYAAARNRMMTVG